MLYGLLIFRRVSLRGELSCTLPMRHGKVPVHVLLNVPPFLLADDRHGLPSRKAMPQTIALSSANDLSP